MRLHQKVFVDCGNEYMPQKLRKNKVKQKGQKKTNLSVAREAGQHPKPLYPLPNQAFIASKSKVTIAEKSVSYRYVRQELKRTGIIAGIIFVVLVILYLFLP